VLKKLLAVLAVLLSAAAMTSPALAQDATEDLGVPYGSEQWIAHQYGSDPTFCQDIAKDPTTQQQWVDMYGDAISSYCGW
jgi:hypothetical protein